MKRFNRKSSIAIGLASLAILAIVAWRFALPTHAEAPHLERYLPASTIAFVQVHDLRAQALNVADSEAWHEFAKSNPSASALFLMGANHSGILDASYAIALTGATLQDGRLRPSVALIAEFNSGEARAEFERRVLRFGEFGRRAAAQRPANLYGDVQIESAGPADKPSVFYARRENTMVLSDSAETVKTLVDVQESRMPSLESNAQLKLARTRIAYNDGMFGFLDGAALTRLVDAIPPDKRGGVESFRQFFHNAGADSVEAVAMTSAFTGGRVVERFTAVSPSGGHGLLRTAMNTPATSQSLLLLVPSDATNVFDASIANAAQSFEEFVELMRQVTAQAGAPGPDEALQKILAETGVDVRNDIVASLGSEVCLAQIPTPAGDGGVVLLNLSDPSRFESAAQTAAKHQGASIATRDYQGESIKTITGPKNQNASYAIVRGNFIASNNASAIERIIDVANAAPSLSATSAYQTAASALTDSPLFVYYGSNKHFVNRLGSMLSGRDTKFQQTDQASNLKPSFAFGVVKSDGFYVESSSPLGTFPQLLTIVTSKLAAERPAGERPTAKSD